MAKGISLHVGVNRTDAEGTENLSPLEGCVNDAQAMMDIAESRGFTTKLVVDGDATFDTVCNKIRAAAQQLDDGDIFLFTFSGHGTSRSAPQGGGEPDRYDETIVLFDKILIDNVLRLDLWPEFKSGVRIVMVSDSCHSGSVSMSGGPDLESDNGVGTTLAAGPASIAHASLASTGGYERRTGDRNFAVRGLPQMMADEHFRLQADFYRELEESLMPPPPIVAAAGAVASAAVAAAPKPILARLLLLAACKDSEETLDGHPHGVFTQALIDVWNTSGTKTYKQLWNGVKPRVQPKNPVINEFGSSFADTEAFRI